MSENVKKFMDALNTSAKSMMDKAVILLAEMEYYDTFVDNEIGNLSGEEKEELESLLDGETPILDESKEVFNKLRAIME